MKKLIINSILLLLVFLLPVTMFAEKNYKKVTKKEIKKFVVEGKEKFDLVDKNLMEIKTKINILEEKIDLLGEELFMRKEAEKIDVTAEKKSSLYEYNIKDFNVISFNIVKNYITVTLKSIDNKYLVKCKVFKGKLLPLYALEIVDNEVKLVKLDRNIFDIKK